MGIDVADVLAHTLRYGNAPPSTKAAFDRFATSTGTDRWSLAWHAWRATPARIFGRGTLVPGVMADAAKAEAHARSILALHADLLLGDVELTNLELVANEASQGVRTVAFAQRAKTTGGAIAVVSGQTSLRYVADRLVAVVSDLVPGAHVRVPLVLPAHAEATARQHLLQTHGRAEIDAAPDLVVLPIHRGATVDSKTSFRVGVRTEHPFGRFVVYVDAQSGAVASMDDLLRFGHATLSLEAPVRGPAGARAAYPAKLERATVAGVDELTDEEGAIGWDADAAASVVLHPYGSSIAVHSADGIEPVWSSDVDDGASATWSAPDVERTDAAISAFVHAGEVKARARAIDPTLPFVTSSTTYVNVNLDDPQGCNAFWDGSQLNFMLERGPCNNTARIGDVVYHEFGHGFHQASVIAGAGALDPSLGEGSSDYLAATMTGDPEIAPGFYRAGGYLRELDTDRRWPDDISGDPHETGLIVAGALWDLRSNLIADLGSKDGVATADHLYQAVLKRAASLPASYVELLVGDDDDGDLDNGTPHICAINEALSRHGLAPVLSADGLVMHHEPLTQVTADAPIVVETHAEHRFPRCASAPVDKVEIVWGRRGGTKITTALTPSEAGWSVSLPAAHDGTELEYQIVTTVADASTSLPTNAADPWYRMYVGATKRLYCTDFESNIDGWVSGSTKGQADFEWGVPQGKHGDPSAAFSGTRAIGDDLGIKGDGLYSSNRNVFFESPRVEVPKGAKPRLQFRRWLTVQDGALDVATIAANGHALWENAATNPDSATLDHMDQEWRFEDVDLTPFIGPSDAASVAVRFSLQSDARTNEGGWTVDDFCIVVRDPPAPMDAGVDASPSVAEEPPANEVVAGGCSVAQRSSQRGAAAGLWALGVVGLATAARRIRRKPRSSN